ncbi:MAG TPA: GlsB/YeaQ/YmgE family stress response membrane protein [Nocardioidaceae bacterium]|nr:GlsB/YeaQ/YmgE family stress response membrane protein [Nocardioidaceae bacterium]
MSWIFVIIAGIIIGLLGKFVAPKSRDNTPLWLTIVCGIVGVIIGYGIFGGTAGFDWIAFFISIVIAAVLVMIAATVTGRARKA